MPANLLRDKITIELNSVIKSLKISAFETKQCLPINQYEAAISAFIHNHIEHRFRVKLTQDDKIAFTILFESAIKKRAQQLYNSKNQGLH